MESNSDGDAHVHSDALSSANGREVMISAEDSGSLLPDERDLSTAPAETLPASPLIQPEDNASNDTSNITDTCDDDREDADDTFDETHSVRSLTLQRRRSSSRLQADVTSLTTLLTQASLEREDLESEVAILKRQLDKLSKEADAKDAEWYERVKGLNEIILQLRKEAKEAKKGWGSRKWRTSRKPASEVDESMAEAKFESDVLRAVVAPMEIEMARLRRRIISLEQEQEKASVQTDASMTDNYQKLYEQTKRDKGDLLVKMDVMQTQQRILIDDLQQAKLELRKEQAARADLELTWRRANEMFMEVQRANDDVVHRLQSELAALRGTPTDFPDEESSADNQDKQYTSAEAERLRLLLEEERRNAAVQLSTLDHNMTTLRDNYETRFIAQEEELQRQKDHYESTIEAQRIKISMLDARVKQLLQTSSAETSVVDYAALCSNYESQLVARQAEIDRLRLEAEKANQDADQVLEACLEERRNAAIRYARTCKESMEAYEKDVDLRYRKRIQKLEIEVHDAMTHWPFRLDQIEDAQNAVEEQMSEFRALLEQAESAKKSEVGRLRASLKDFEEQLKFKTAEAESLSNILFARDESIATLQKQNQQLIETTSKLEDQLTTQEQVMTQLTSKCEAAAKAKNTMHIEMVSLQEEMAELRTKQRRDTERLKQLEMELERFRAHFSSAHDETLSGKSLSSSTPSVVSEQTHLGILDTQPESSA
eukprot:m.241092 g.241092  ORF g.241092 m.241092 type:complete len:715 (+) comp17131_c4_seq22:98-2242(+)